MHCVCVCVQGAAANWYDKDWSYRPQYNWKVGKPLAPAVRAGKYRWHRKFERCTVSVDLTQAQGNFSSCGVSSLAKLSRVPAAEPKQRSQ
jgi:hypothetical protein